MDAWFRDDAIKVWQEIQNAKDSNDTRHLCRFPILEPFDRTLANAGLFRKLRLR
jgi:hypothetical protein